MGRVIVNVSSFDLTSHNGNTAYSTIRSFDIPANAGITKCVATFATHVNTGNFQGKAFTFNGVQAHPNTPWPTSGIELNPSLLVAGTNTFRGSIKSQAGLSARWSIGDIILTIDYVDPSGGGPNIGQVSIDKTSLVAGETLKITATACDSVYSRSIYLMLPNNTVIQTVGANFGTAAKTWNVVIPKSWCAAYAPNADAIQLKVYMEAYQTGTLIGSVTKKFTMQVPDTAQPTIGSFILTRIANVPAGITGYVKGYSGVSCEINGALGALGSTISSYKIEGAGKAINAASGSIEPLNVSGTIPITATVTDTRGRTVIATQNIIVLDYSLPTILLPEVSRATSGGVKSPTGTYILAKGQLIFSPLDGQNSCKLWVRFYEKDGTPPAYTEIIGGELLVSGAAINHSYTVELKASDSIAEYVYTVEIPTPRAHINGYPSEIGGIAFGGYAEEEDAAVVKYSKFKHGTDPVAKYRVGDWLFTDDPTHPSLIYGGVWEQLPPGTFLAAAGTGYAVGSTGGNKNITLGLGGGYAKFHHATNVQYMKVKSAAWTSSYGVSSMPTGNNYAGSMTQGLELGGTTDQGDNRPPYYATYMWRRTA